METENTSNSYASWLSARPIFYVLIIAFALTAFSYIIQGNIGLNLSDEGYLWYGVIRTAHGETPTLDFRSYDPGRYYWAAALSTVFGQGILGLRLSVLCFQFVGLSCGLLAVSRAFKSPWILTLVGFMLIVWMFPRHKLFEHNLALIGIYLAVLLIERSVFRNYFLLGVGTGLAGFFGRNHGTYFFVASLLLITLLAIKLRPDRIFRRYAVWAAGVVTGYMPMIVMFLVFPGMFDHYVDAKLLIFIQRGATDLKLPVPWFWTQDYSNLKTWDAATVFIVGLLFVILPLFYLTLLLWYAIRDKDTLVRYPLLLASCCIGVAYMYQAFGRSDAPHLTQAIPSFLVGMVALMDILRRHNQRLLVAACVLFLASSSVAISTFQPLLDYLRYKELYTTYVITGNTMRIPIWEVNYLEIVRHVVDENLAPGELIYIAPHSPTLYPFLGLPAPVYDTYSLFPETEENQRKIIEDLQRKQVNLALIQSDNLDNREDLRFDNTQPLVWEYLQSEFELMDVSGLLPEQHFYRRKDQSPTDG